MRRIVPILAAVLLTLLSAAAAENLRVEASQETFSVDFSLPGQHFAVVRYATDAETGWFTLYSPDGHFSGEGTLQCACPPCRLRVTTQTVAFRSVDRVSVDWPGISAPEGVPMPFADRPGVVRDLVLTPVDGGVAYRFTAEGHGSVRLQYRTVRETGSVFLCPDADYVYEGVLSLPRTYNQSNVHVAVFSGKDGRELAEGTGVRGYTLTRNVAEPAPEGRLRGVIVCVDAGHQNVRGGRPEPLGPGLYGEGGRRGGMAEGVATRRRESVVMLECAYVLRDELLRQGATVIMTRDTEETWLSNIERADIANAGGAHVMLRLHGDLHADANTRGFSVIYPNRSDYARAVADRETYTGYATLIMNALAEKASEGSGVRPRISTSDDYVGNNWAEMPCFLVELGFMSNVQDDVLLSAPEHQQQLAEGLAEGVYRLMVERGVIRPEE